MAELMSQIEPLGVVGRSGEGEAVDQNRGVARAVDLDGGRAEPHESGSDAFYPHGAYFLPRTRMRVMSTAMPPSTMTVMVVLLRYTRRPVVSLMLVLVVLRL